MLRRHRERLGWSIADLEETRAEVVEREARKAREGSKEDNEVDASSSFFITTRGEGGELEAGSTDHQHETAPSAFPELESKDLTALPLSFTPHPLDSIHSISTDGSPSAAQGRNLAARLLHIWKDAPESVRKILQGQHASTSQPSHHYASEANLMTSSSHGPATASHGVTGSAKELRTPSPHPPLSRPSSRLGARSATPPLGRSEISITVRSGSPFEQLPEETSSSHLSGEPAPRAKSLLLKFDLDAPAVTKAAPAKESKSRPMSPKASKSRDPSRPSSPGPLHSSTKPQSHPHKGAVGGAQWAVEAANLERQLLLMQLRELPVDLPHAVR